MLATTLVIVFDIIVVVGGVAMIAVTYGYPRVVYGLLFFPD